MDNHSLKELSLRKCGMGSESANQLGKLFEKNTSLISVCIAMNFDIGDEGLIRIAEGLDQNEFLKELNVTECRLTSKSVKRFGEMLEKNRSLTKILLDGNGSIESDGFAGLLKGMEENHSLEHISLRWCILESEDAKRIGEMLEKNTSLSFIDIQCTKFIGEDGFVRIVKGLEKNTSILQLRVDTHQISQESLNSIDMLLERNRVIQIESAIC
eukprot:TRINITY_DN858_c1_g1_i6.p1 TRINITY_DN858_c1_g1~~TRINITY_DN858_c1_g1_i6.p1  ORF type:complete len:213 (+),score=57.47 TRINITY_DN858_c1_g1_i6:444-1082(+)